MREKFAAKFPEAGNLKLHHVSQISHFVTTRSGLDIDRFPQHFSAGCSSRARQAVPNQYRFSRGGEAFGRLKRFSAACRTPRPCVTGH